MKKINLLSFGSKFYIGFSILSLAMVSLLSMYNPQSTMDLVSVNLTNNDAVSSLRGIYGGVGITLVISLLYLMVRYQLLALRFLVLFWGMYAVSRYLTIATHGPLGEFGNRWVMIETLLFMVGTVLILLNRKSHSNQPA